MNLIDVQLAATKLELVLNKHRSDAMSCPETCWCWDVDNMLNALAAPPDEDQWREEQKARYDSK